MNRFNCFLQTCWYTLNHLFNGGNAIVEGHTYRNSEYHEGVVVMIDKCEDCGKTMITWCSPLMFKQMKAEGKI